MSEELLFVVDENDQPLEPVLRSEAISKQLWRRVSGIMIIDRANNRVLCQKRSEAKDERPGFWIAMHGGKFAPGESPVMAALRELKEELGVELSELDLAFYKKVKSEDRRQFEYLYWLNWSGDSSKVHFDPKEVSEIAWRDNNEVAELLTKDPAWYSYGYDLEMLQNS